MSNIAMRRLLKELEQLEKDPVEGLSIYSDPSPSASKTLPSYEAKISGPSQTPYENGTFTLSISVPQRYPIEPPTIVFKTRIYHPNIDDSGRICLDILKGAPKGKWNPALSLRSVLISIQSLLAEPNPDDWLMSEIAQVYRDDRKRFDKKAREMTEKHAMTNRIVIAQSEEESGKSGNEGTGATESVLSTPSSKEK
mmetsp:Transcript_6593/g.24688  ORF Transcript_6593/g.24688 Transcript_6593/m.24688 type:complete len:196 (+) Transcript_6593:4084-4671(+)